MAHALGKGLQQCRHDVHQHCNPITHDGELANGRRRSSQLALHHILYEENDRGSVRYGPSVPPAGWGDRPNSSADGVEARAAFVKGRRH